ncbi:hypothetical protein ASG49_16090 [Marmoricola sp. Leaf446]|uniref:hypothetical protein n=1 Tax=Marmoricola sp. Leaf446 TaxID=1736379 RepID=UPI0006FFB9BA|nr:hypothetical protein [Marmoricola sp. Leaf446]KQT89302.1 hypothetical protein ASG49_16090 [Marmoricola sp. Leaf446]
MRGGYGSGDHGTLADRVAGRHHEPAVSPAPPVPQTPARHCRVDGEPSLLVEWCRTERGWEGRVVSVVWVDAVGWATVARWLPAADIEPVP